MPVDALELQIASALQRFTRLKQSADNIRSESPGLATPRVDRAGDRARGAACRARSARRESLPPGTAADGTDSTVRQVLELFELMPAAYVVTTPNSTITEANKAGRRAVQRQPAVSDWQDPRCVRLRGSRAPPDRSVPAVRAAGVGGADVQDAAAGARGRRCLRTRQRRHPVPPMVDSDAAAVERRARSTAVAFPPFAPVIRSIE
jgi:hypothetical protein